MSSTVPRTFMPESFSQQEYPEPSSVDEHDIVDLDLDAVPREELDDLDSVSDQLMAMDITFKDPTQQSMRTAMRYTKEQLLQMELDSQSYLPPIRCRCNRIVDQAKWERLWRLMLENYDTYAGNPGKFKELMDELGIPERECCRITYTTPQLITKTTTLPGVIMDRVPRFARDDVEKKTDLDAPHKAKKRVYYTSTMGHTYDW